MLIFKILIFKVVPKLSSKIFKTFQTYTLETSPVQVLVIFLSLLYQSFNSLAHLSLFFISIVSSSSSPTAKVAIIIKR